ncbi:ribosomal-processing cysteine protease Prp [Phosphitispora sp. TUW77]|uniref:ribosomal-processing cysteine protease Prp n=1 Tax=Phosphitispora sp. TUW77 TaxID=3152361 RepID=UPI003AB785F6
MIIVSIERSNGTIRGYTVKGHAGYLPPGEDIVCAAVSMLTQTTLLGLMRFIKEGLSYHIDSLGTLTCRLPEELSKKEQLQAQAILETMVMGLKNLQGNYKGYIRVFNRRWTS